MYMSILSACMYVYHVCAWGPRGSEESIRSLETTVTDGCWPPNRCWELNPDLLEGQTVLLTTEPSLQPVLLKKLLYTIYLFVYLCVCYVGVHVYVCARRLTQQKWNSEDNV